MPIRPKTKRRLLILGAVFLGLCCLFSALIWFQERRHRREQALMRKQAHEFYIAGDYQSAADVLKDYTAQLPEDAEALLMYAGAEQNLPGGAAVAMDALRQYLDLNPSPTDALDAEHRLLTLEMSANETDQANDLAQQILNLYPNDLPALSALAQARYAVSRYQEALAPAEKYNELNPTDLDGQQLTYEIMHERNMSLAHLLLRAQGFEKKYPNDVRFKLAEVIAYTEGYDPTAVGPNHEKLETTEEKLLMTISAPPVDPPDAQFVAHAVKLLDRIKQYPASQSLLKRAADKLGDPQTQLMYVQRLWQNGEDGEVVNQLKDVTPDNARTSASLLAYKALALHDLGRKDEADALLKSLAARSNDLEAVAWSLGLKADFYPDPSTTKQFADYRSAIEADRNNGVLRLMLAQAYLSANEQDLAVEEGLTATQLLPSWGKAHLLVAQILLRRPGAAFAEAYRQADSARLATANLNDETAETAIITDDVCKYFYVQSRHDMAGMVELLKSIQDFQATHPGEPTTLDLWVRLLAQTGQLDKARDLIRQTLNNPGKGGQPLLLNLARDSAELDLGMEQQVLSVAEERFGLTPVLAYDRAIEGVKTGKQTTAQALAGLQAATRTGTGKAWEWSLAQDRFLEQMRDPSAKDAWETLGNAYPQQLDVQEAILNVDQAPSAWKDAAFINTTIDRLKALVGDDEHALNWRLAKARLLLADQDPATQLASAKDASKLLNDIINHPVASESEAEPHQMLAQAYERLGNVDRALSEMAKAQALAPNDVGMTYQLLRLNHLNGKFNEARDAFDKLAALPSSSISPAIAQSASAIMVRQHELSRAAEMLSHYSDTPSTPSGITALLAMTYQQMGRVKDAADLYQLLLNAPDLTPQMVQAAANFFGGEGALPTAHQFLDRLNTMTGRPGEKEQTLAVFEENFGDPVKAGDLYRKAVDADPRNVGPVVQYVGYLIRRKQLADAQATLTQAMATWPRNPELATLEQLTQVDSNPTLQAQLAALSNVLSSDPGDPAVAAMLQCMLDSRKLKPADALARLLDLHQKYPDFYPLYELCVRRIFATAPPNDEDARLPAVQMAQEAMSKFPDSAAAARLAASAQAQDGNWSEALNNSQEWRNRAPQHPEEADWYIAVCQINLGNSADAVTRLQPYAVDAQHDPEEPVNHDLLRAYAGALIVNGQTSQAADLLMPLAKKSAAWRGEWLAMTKSTFTSPDTASAWINQVAPLIPADSVPEQTLLAIAWFDLATHLSYRDGFVKCEAVLMPLANQKKLPQGAMLTLAEAQDQLGEAQALTTYDQVVQADGGHNASDTATARNNLATLLLAKGDPASLAEAEPLARAAVASPAPDAEQTRPYYYDTLARIYMKEKQPERAIEQFRQANQMLNNDPIIMIGWADAYVQAKKMDRATVMIEQVDQRLAPGTRLSPELQQELDTVRQAIRKPGGTRSSLTNSDTAYTSQR